MWIFLNDAFLSIVDKDGDGNTLLVRARHAGDIERVFPEAKVQVGGGTDYRYRARIGRERVASAIAEAVRNVDYGNFKDTVLEAKRHDAYMEVWSAMYAYQRNADTPRRRP